MPTREQVLLVIHGEREYQNNLGPDRTAISEKRPFEVGEELCILATYIRRAEFVDRVNDRLETLHAMRKIAATAQRCLEHHYVGDPFEKVDMGTYNFTIRPSVQQHIQNDRPGRRSTVNALQHLIEDTQDAWTNNPGVKAALEGVRLIFQCAVRCMEENGAPRRILRSKGGKV